MKTINSGWMKVLWSSLNINRVLLENVHSTLQLLQGIRNILTLGIKVMREE